MLHDDIKTTRSAGVTTLISLLEPDEAKRCGLEKEAEICNSFDITFQNYPIRDMHLPEPAAFAAFAEQIAIRIRAGENVALHCYASIGRSGMLTCAILGHFGYIGATAIAHTSKMRGQQIPDTPQQVEFITQIMEKPCL
ncbi:Dual specificity protein phosphatase [Sulfitobacter guttiformis KCTC 32187]|nr:hypothetical protein [Sulfitobacter guttiformis]KIN74069.1 Dual specificity protein phosphatase [Sulfitobacter guttiformis KCTC 32187]